MHRLNCGTFSYKQTSRLWLYYVSSIYHNVFGERVNPPAPPPPQKKNSFYISDIKFWHQDQKEFCITLRCRYRPFSLHYLIQLDQRNSVAVQPFDPIYTSYFIQFRSCKLFVTIFNLFEAKIANNFPLQMTKIRPYSYLYANYWLHLPNLIIRPTVHLQ